MPKKAKNIFLQKCKIVFAVYKIVIIKNPFAKGAGYVFELMISIIKISIKIRVSF